MGGSRLWFFAVVLTCAGRVHAQAGTGTAPSASEPGTPASETGSEAAPADTTLGPAEADTGEGTPGAAGDGAAVATTDEASSGPTEAQRAAAREAYERGGRLFAEGDFEGAKAAFEAALAAVPNPIVLVPIAEASLKLGRVPEAIALFERYLSERPDAPDRAEIEQRLQTLRSTPAVLVVASTTPGVTVSVDGKPLTGALPQELPLAPGPHQLVASADGFTTQREELTAEAGIRHEWNIQLERAPAATPPAPPAVAEVPPEPDTTAAIWVSGIVGATGLLAGSVLGFMALAENSDYDADPTAAGADRGERLALFADVAFGIGAMALVTGAVLYLTDDAPLSEEADDSAARSPFQVAGGVSPDGAFLSTTVRY